MMARKTKTNGKPVAKPVLSARRRRLSEYYQALVGRIRLNTNGSPFGQLIGVTSCARRAGVTTVAVNMALSAAQAGIERVLLVDANVGRRCVHRAFRIRRARGLSDALSGSVDPMDCVHSSPVTNLSVVVAGGDRRGIVPIYDHSAVTEVLDTLKGNFKFLVFDLPPVSEPTTCLALAAELDGVVLVIEAERAECRAALRAKQQLEDVDARLLGVVLNKHDNHLPSWLFQTP